MHIPVLSVITVCFNACEELKQTLENVLTQEWIDYEYLVIDGGSSDHTVSLLEHFAPLFEAKGISFSYTSEPDRGIYDAMNKGTRMASGKWLLFLNAGDLLCTPDVLKKIFTVPHQADILYGDTICIYQGNQKKYPALPLDHLAYEMAFCHQSAFVSHGLLLEYPYDISYKVCADHQFFLHMYLKKKTFEYVPFPVAVYEISGFSDKNKLLSHQEKLRIQKEFGVFRVSPSWLLRELVFYLKYLIKSVFGQKLINLVRKKRLR